MFEVQPEEEFFWAVPLVSKRTGWLLGNCFWRAGFEAGFRTEWRGELVWWFELFLAISV